MKIFRRENNRMETKRKQILKGIWFNAKRSIIIWFWEMKRDLTPKGRTWKIKRWFKTALNKNSYIQSKWRIPWGKMLTSR